MTTDFKCPSMAVPKASHCGISSAEFKPSFSGPLSIIHLSRCSLRSTDCVSRAKVKVSRTVRVVHLSWPSNGLSVLIFKIEIIMPICKNGMVPPTHGFSATTSTLSHLLVPKGWPHEASLLKFFKMKWPSGTRPGQFTGSYTSGQSYSGGFLCGHCTTKRTVPLLHGTLSTAQKMPGFPPSTCLFFSGCEYKVPNQMEMTQ